MEVISTEYLYIALSNIPAAPPHSYKLVYTFLKIYASSMEKLVLILQGLDLIMSFAYSVGKQGGDNSKKEFSLL